MQKVLESGKLTAGPFVEQFEKELAHYCSYPHAVAVSSGTAALHVIFHALGIGPGDQVIVPDFTFIATANAARYVGANNVFVDVDPDFFTMDPHALEAAITSQTKAIVPVSLYGQAYDVDEISKIAKEHDLLVISDNAQSIGAKWKSNANLGDAAQIQSFYPTKNMTTGEGGAILTDSSDLAEKCRLWRNIGQRKPYDYACAGYNYRLPAVNCAMGSAQLQKLPKFTEARRKNARILNDLLSSVPQIQTPTEREHAFHVFNQYTVKAENRDALWEHLKKKEIGANVYYPHPLHSLATFNANAQTPITEKLCQTVLSLPVHPSVTEAQIQEIAEAVKSFYR
ncbi:DegT/DnrJ/EryC1/StrS family aminotransferase [Candidatus Micrarchaeota archaeon]|nr:DegT/DnrJ/EryC1/StrS family aminotransferase [Candidatus Micrarchaeota archaeon]